MRLHLSIRTKIISTLIAILFVTTTSTTLTFRYIIKSNSLNDYVKKYETIDKTYHQISSLEKDFFVDDTRDTNFFITGSSKNLRERTTLLNQLDNELNSLDSNHYTAFLGLQDSLRALEKDLNNYLGLFEASKALYLKRGFYKHGHIGQMRKWIILFEQDSSVLQHKDHLLLMRNSEKNYFLRGDVNYLQQHKLHFKSLQTKVSSKPKVQAKLHNYLTNFHIICSINKEIGSKRTQGILNELHQLETKIESDLSNILALADKKSLSRKSDLKISLITSIAFALLLTTILTMAVLAWLGKPMKNLSKAIHDSILKDFEPFNIPEQKRGDEIGEISRDVDYLLHKIRNSLEAINTQQSQLLDSLEYAQRIQATMMPKPTDFDKFFSKHAIIYKPKKIVSGDFYWMQSTGPYLYLAVVDCTGHGVPGAFMSIMGLIMLRNIVNSNPGIDSQEVLKLLDYELKHAIKDANAIESEAMAVSLVRITKNNNYYQIQAVGSKQNLYIQSQGNLLEVRGAKQKLGSENSLGRPFRQFETKLYEGDRLFFFTDGFKDQNNLSRLRFGKKRILEILDRNYAHSLDKLHNDLNTELSNHMKDTVLRDDITFVGLEI